MRISTPDAKAQMQAIQELPPHSVAMPSSLAGKLRSMERSVAAPPSEPAEEAPVEERPLAEPTTRKTAEPAAEPAPPEVKQWVAELGDKDPGVRFNAAVKLGDSGYKPAADSLAEVLEKDDDTFVRRVAARSIGKLDAWHSIPALIETLGDKEYFVAIAATHRGHCSCDPEVGQHSVPVGEQDVLGLYIAVNYASAMRIIQCF